MKRRGGSSLPLGIDVGRDRVRVALCERRDGKPQLLAVASRPAAGDRRAAVAAAVAELGTAERRCILALAPPDALINELQLPAMSGLDRIRAARFEATRFIDYPLEDATVSLAPIDGRDRWRVGVARRKALAERVGLARSAGLAPVAVDDYALALGRALPGARSIVDVGGDATSVVVRGPAVPLVTRLPIGGDQLTEAIARSLGIDATAAEQRKHTIGFAGAGEAQRDALIAAIGETLQRARATLHVEIEPVVLVGNGSRIPRFAEAIERATGLGVQLAELDARQAAAIPPDVARAAGADWALAVGLSLWSAAG